MSWIYKKKQLKHSGCYDMNLLFNDGKFYIMDNHLAASWCWSQKIDISKKYGLLHIDRHYDLLNNLSDEFLCRNRDILTGNDFFAYLDLRDQTGQKVLRYDNYLDTFNRLYPNLIQQIYYVTHKDGDDEEKTSLASIETYKPDLWDLDSNIKYWITKTHKDIERWIINIDIDFFFKSHNDNRCFQFLTQKYIQYICREIRVSLPNIDVITIAMSPEFCGGWGDAFNILRIINAELGIPMLNKYKRIKGKSYLR
ncbi:MAG: UPF0489 family protein [Bacteroides xylanisolvens]